MAKISTTLLFNSYLWLVETIYSAGTITRKEIDEKWAMNTSVNINGETEISERTFHRWRIAAEELFNINITCNRIDNSYRIEESKEDIKKEMSGIRGWLFNTLSVNNLVNECKGSNLQNYLLFEDVPSGQQYLSTILSAIRDRRKLNISHKSFGNINISKHEISPLCLKIFKQRWYVLAIIEDGEQRLFALDRVLEISISDNKFTFPKGFNPREKFKNIYGVSFADKQPEKVQVKVFKDQVEYLRTLPLHPSQKEVQTTAEYSVFEFYLFPNHEFMQELAMRRSSLEVLSPNSLRENFYNELKKMLEMYERKVK